MKVKVLFAGLAVCCITSCATNDANTERSNEDSASSSVINAEGAENNPYNLPGSDTGAIHENTTEPGVLDKDARDSSVSQ